MTKKKSPYDIASFILVALVAILFTFPLYWIITGSFKTKAEIMSVTPIWWPSEWVMDNYNRLMEKRKAPLFEFLGMTGPTIPAAFRWLINTVFMSVASMVITCITAALAGYALAKKRFIGRTVLFSLIVCAMALPKQVILIPLIREMSSIGLYDTLWATIIPIVGWPFGVFLLKQFSEGVPGEMLEAACVDGAGEIRTFVDIVLPMIKPGIGALAIFTFINSWNEYPLQLVMLTQNESKTIALGIASKLSEMSNDFGLIMAGAALASVPIIIVFLCFQKYFTQGITMGAVKG